MCTLVFYRNIVKASRVCGHNCQWSDINFSGCTLISSQMPFLLLWFMVEPSQLIYDLEFEALTEEVGSFIYLFIIFLICLMIPLSKSHI